MFALSLWNPQSGSLMNNLNHFSRSEETLPALLLIFCKLWGFFRTQTDLEVGRRLLPRRAAVPPRTVCVSVSVRFPGRRRWRRRAAGGRRRSWERPAAPNTAEGEPDGRRNRTGRRFQWVKNKENTHLSLGQKQEESQRQTDFLKVKITAVTILGNIQDLFS